MDSKQFEKAVKRGLKKLPLLTKVAFAARCARRVQPLFASWTTDASLKDIVAKAILSRESYASGEAIVVKYATAAYANRVAGDSADNDVANAYGAAHFAASEILKDIETLTARSRAGNWTDNTQVPQSVFDPMWRVGILPEGWLTSNPGRPAFAVRVTLPEYFDQDVVAENLT